MIKSDKRTETDRQKIKELEDKLETLEYSTATNSYFKLQTQIERLERENKELKNDKTHAKQLLSLNV